MANDAEQLLAGEPLEDVTVQGGNAVPEARSNIVPLDLFTAWRRQKEPAE